VPRLTNQLKSPIGRETRKHSREQDGAACR
jgi:hypothetical protein